MWNAVTAFVSTLCNIECIRILPQYVLYFQNSVVHYISLLCGVCSLSTLWEVSVVTVGRCVVQKGAVMLVCSKALLFIFLQHLPHLPCVITYLLTLFIYLSIRFKNVYLFYFLFYSNCIFYS